MTFCILFLADISEKIRNNSAKNYGLCSCHYFSASALSWDALLNMTKVELKLISDPKMYTSVKNLREVEFLTFMIDLVKSAISI